MDRLDNLKLLLRIVERGGFAAAGRDFGLSPSTVSERITALEAHYGARLLNRTTRAVHPTDEGRRLIESAQIIIDEEDNIELRLRAGVERLSGLIRLTSPEDLGRSFILPLVGEFQEQNPDVIIDLNLTDRYVDLVSSGFDFGLRLGDLKDSSLIRRKVAGNRRIACASPEYCERWGVPKHPYDLADHKCLIMRNGLSFDNQWFFKIDKSLAAVKVAGDRISNDGGIVRQWCKDGHGIALKSIWDVGGDLASGALIEVLQDYAVPGGGSLQMVHGGGRQLPRRIVTLMDFLAERLEAYPEDSLASLQRASA